MGQHCSKNVGFWVSMAITEGKSRHLRLLQNPRPPDCLQSRRPIPERCHSIVTEVIFRLRDARLFACCDPQCKYPKALMQKLRACSLSHSFVPHAFSLSPSLTLWMFTLWRFPLVECTPAPLFLLPSFLSPFPLCHLLSSIASHLTSLAVTLDFKALLHSSVTHKREGYSVLR